jgi:uncharacterized membrane protein YbhN (UPF0104 family)
MSRAEPVAGGGWLHRWWPTLRRLLLAGFFVLVASLLFSQARSIDWGGVAEVLRGYRLGTLLLAGALAAASYFVYSCFDLLGRKWTRHRVPVRQVMLVTFVSYAFNLNLGSLLGGVGFRFRLYSRLGLDSNVITRVLSLSLVTNWLGYLLLAGAVFALRIISPPDDWKIGAGALQVLGVCLLGLAAAYVLMCARSRRRAWTLRGHEFTLPPLRLALTQLLMSCANWMLIAAVIHVLLQYRVSYPVVLGVLLIAAIAGVVIHIPAGLGVIEAVFIALLEAQIPRGELLAALLAYRALYYLVPLLLATGVYFALEARARKAAGSAGRVPATSD